MWPTVLIDTSDVIDCCMMLVIIFKQNFNSISTDLFRQKKVI